MKFRESPVSIFLSPIAIVSLYRTQRCVKLRSSFLPTPRRFQNSSPPLNRFLPVRRCLSFLLWTLCVLPSSSLAQDGAKFLIVVSDGVPIYRDDSPNNQVLGMARAGDTFRLHSQRGQLYGIEMFSGITRYVFAQEPTEVRVVADAPIDPATITSTEKRRSIYKRLQKLEKRNYTIAAQSYPDDIARQVDLQRALDDASKLEICHEESLHTLALRPIALEGRLGGWQGDPRPVGY